MRVFRIKKAIRDGGDLSTERCGAEDGAPILDRYRDSTYYLSVIPVRTLPPDWQDRVLDVSAAPALRPFVEHLQQIVGVFGAEALLVEHVRELVEVVFPFKRPKELFPEHRAMFERLIAAAGDDWPVAVPLEERSVAGKSPLALTADLDSAQAEWWALDKLTGEGWLPRTVDRKPGEPDWLVERQEVLPVEVKFKKDPSYVPTLASAMLGGLGMAPHASFLTRYLWTWELPTDARDKDVLMLVGALQGNLSEVEELLKTGIALMADPIPLLDAEGYRLAASTGWNDGAQRPEGVDFILSRDRPGEIELHARPCDIFEKGAWEPGSLFAFHQQTFDSDAETAFAKVLTRLGLEKQLKKRPECLAVVAWRVPPEWIRGAALDSIRTFWNRFTEEQGWQRAALWPMGAFEMTGAPWLLNEGAAEVLG